MKEIKSAEDVKKLLSKNNKLNSKTNKEKSILIKDKITSNNFTCNKYQANIEDNKDFDNDNKNNIESYNENLEEIDESISSSDFHYSVDYNYINDINCNFDDKKGCKAGFTVTDEIIEEDNLKSKIFKYISYKKRTESEIRQKFSNVNQDVLDNVINYFKSQNYINEDEYIERSIKEFLAVKNLSIKEITYKLLQKGVNKRNLDDYIVKNKETLVNYEIESAKKLILKKSTKMEVEDIKKYLFQKGYMSETISIAIDEILEE